MCASAAETRRPETGVLVNYADLPTLSVANDLIVRPCSCGLADMLA